MKPLRELAYLPKGVMDPHDLSPSDSRAGKLPEEVLDWMKPTLNNDQNNSINQKTN